MRGLRYFVVDAFTNTIFGGNPAGICVIDNQCDKELMQKIATENNLSETAFITKTARGQYDLKWFTPRSEIDLCGHATLGAAFVVRSFLDVGIDTTSFSTQSGKLNVIYDGSLFRMNFPARMPRSVPVTKEMAMAINGVPQAAYLARDLMLVLNSEEEVAGLDPNITGICRLSEGLGVIVTAKGKHVDFVSRCFYPKIGVDEDPVTGSAHSHLIPFWAEKTGKAIMVADQLSARGGRLFCELAGERVIIGGEAVLYLVGEIYI